MRVNGPDGAPLGDIGVSLDGQSLGRTSSGGSLTIEGLDPGARLLRLDGGELYTEAELKLKLKAGDNRAESKLSYEPGAGGGGGGGAGASGSTFAAPCSKITNCTRRLSARLDSLVSWVKGWLRP